MPDTLFCIADQTAEACAKANGWPGPFTFNMQSGAGSPEDVNIGYGPASAYFDTEGPAWYDFGGVAGTSVGWVLRS